MSSELVRAGVLVAALALSLAVGLWLRRRSGAARSVAGGDVLTAEQVGAPLGARATFVQFSTAVCAPCRATRRVLHRTVAELPAVAHVEVDAEHRLDLVRRFHIVRTPTVLVLDADGRVVRRASGALSPAQARIAVADLVPQTVAP